MLDTSSDAACVSRIAKRCKKSFVNLSTCVSHIKILDMMVIYKMWFVKFKCQTGLVMYFMFNMKVVLPHKEELELHHNMLSSCSQKVTTTSPFCPCSLFPIQENNKLASSKLANCFPRCEPVLVRLGSRQSSSTTPCHQVGGGRQK